MWVTDRGLAAADSPLSLEYGSERGPFRPQQRRDESRRPGRCADRAADGVRDRPRGPRRRRTAAGTVRGRGLPEQVYEQRAGPQREGRRGWAGLAEDEAVRDVMTYVLPRRGLYHRIRKVSLTNPTFGGSDLLCEPQVSARGIRNFQLERTTDTGQCTPTRLRAALSRDTQDSPLPVSAARLLVLSLESARS
jgi:hypothetical protein